MPNNPDPDGAKAEPIEFAVVDGRGVVIMDRLKDRADAERVATCASDARVIVSPTYQSAEPHSSKGPLTERDMRRLAEEVTACATWTMPKEIEAAMSEDQLSDLLADMSDLVFYSLREAVGK